MTFKNGDRVRLVHDHDGEPEGATGTVVGSSGPPYQSLVTVELDAPVGHRTHLTAFNHRFNLIPEDTVTTHTYKTGDRFVILDTKATEAMKGQFGTVVEDQRSFSPGDYIRGKVDKGSLGLFRPEEIYPIDVKPEPEEKILSEIEQANMFLGKKVLVKNSAGAFLHLGKVVSVFREATDSGIVLPIRVTIKSILSSVEATLRFQDYTFEEVE